MFGFIAAPCSGCNKEGVAEWRGAFCGLARCLGREYGSAARLLVNRDAAFIALLGMSIDPREPSVKIGTCCNPFAQPFPVWDTHPATLHAAAVSICGLSAKLKDDCEDEGFVRRKLALLGRIITEPKTNWARAHLDKTRFDTQSAIQTLLRQDFLEKHSPFQSAEPTSRLFGSITAHLATLLSIPEQAPGLYQMGAALGSLVYWRDAWLDQAQDAKKHRYNPFQKLDRSEITTQVHLHRGTRSSARSRLLRQG